MSREDRFQWNDKMGSPTPIRNKDLMCRDCEHRYDDSTLYCDGFRGEKPTAVLKGEDCYRYKLDE